MMNMNIKKTIKKYIFLIIPLLILLSNGLILKIFDGDYSSLSDDMTAFYGIMIVITVSPVVCLIIEIMGFVRAVGCYREIDEDEPKILDNVIDNAVNITTYGVVFLLSQ